MNKPFTNQISAPTALPGAADVRIARIETIPLKVRLDRTANASNLSISHRCTIVTRIHTDAGVIGQCFNGNDDELQGDIIKGLEELMPLIGHVQVASVPKRNEPGTGELDDFRIFRQLDSLGYNGFVGCEYRPANGTLAGLSWLKAAAS